MNQVQGVVLHWTNSSWKRQFQDNWGNLNLDWVDDIKELTV
jgi:hypothetical protein